MLLVQPRKRSRATFDNDHAISRPVSWQANAQASSLHGQASLSVADLSIVSMTCTGLSTISKTKIAALSLEQLQELSTLVSDRIHIKKRYNNTPLRRIIARQASSSAFQAASRSESDTASQTDTLMNIETPETVREPLEVRRARYNSTPLRRILARQVSAEQRDDVSSSAPACAYYEPESLEVRKVRYNNTPLRRIVSRQASSETVQPPGPTSAPPAPSPSVSLSQASIPIPRSNTPFRVILSRQASTQTAPTKDDDELSERADSVIDPDSPIRLRSTASTAVVSLNDEERIRAYETVLWNLTATTSPSSPPSPAPTAKATLNDESRIRVYEEALWAKSLVPPNPPAVKEKGTTIAVTELSLEAKKPKRIVVDSKGSPLRRILQRQTSRDWRAPARVGVV